MTEEERLKKRNESAMEITMKDLETRPEGTPRPKPDGKCKQEMLADDPTRTVAV